MSEAPSSIEYETALACFQAAAELASQGQLVNGPRIKAIVGRGSNSTTKKYADLWKACENSEDIEISDDAQAAYDAVKAGSEEKTTLSLAPPDELTDLLSHIWELAQGWIAAECRETWQEAGDQLEVMQVQVTDAEAMRDVAQAELTQHKAARTSLATQNDELQQLVSKLSGQLEVLELQRQELTDQNAALGQRVSEQANQIMRLTLEAKRYEEQLVEGKRREEEALEKLLAVEKALETMQVAKADLREQVVRLEQIESSLTTQLEQEQTRSRRFEEKIEQQAVAISTLNGEAKAAEERAKQLQHMQSMKNLGSYESESD